MSKKSNKSRSKRRSARRRAARAAERRNRSRPAVQSFTVTDGGTFSVMSIGAGELDALHAYIRAHDLLPSSYPFDDAERQRQLTMALSTLVDPGASSESVLRAIVILGHIPDPRALAGLHDYAEKRKAHAGIAKHAADECAGWIESERAWRDPPRVPSAMMN